MSARDLSLSGGSVKRPAPITIALLLYAATGGVAWWSVHLVALATLSPAVCDGAPAWILTVVNVVCLAGALAATISSAHLSARRDGPSAVPRGLRYLAAVTLLVNIVATALVILESVPVYVLEPC